MKIISKRILCVVVAVCICCSVLPQFFGVTADTAEPALSSRCETVINIAGKDGEFGTSASDLRTSTAIKLGSTVNLSNADVFELDVYVEDIDALKTMISNTQNIQFGFSSNSLTNRNNRADIDITSQLLQSGWNHVLVYKSDFVENNINWSKVRHISLKFANEDLSLSDSIKNKVVKIRNICESFDVPTLNDADITLYDLPVISSLGQSEESSLKFVEETFKAEISSSDLTDITFLNVDLLISDLFKFKNFVADKELNFVLASSEGFAICEFKGEYFTNTIPGWYTVQVPLNDFVKDTNFDISNVTAFKVGIYSDNENEKIGNAYDLKFGFANVRGTKINAMEGKNIFGEVKENYSIQNYAVCFTETYKDFLCDISSNYNALSDAENIEFDLYIENYDEFKNSFLYNKDNTPISASLDLKFSDGTNNLVWSGIEKKVVTSGWNHIILSVSDANNLGFDTNKAFSNISLEITGVEASHKNSIFGSFIIINNLVSTNGEAEHSALKFESYAELSKGNSIFMSNTYESSQLLLENFSSTVDLTDAKFVELDIYIQNFEAFKKLSLDKNITDVSFVLNSSQSDSVSTKILSKITENGWNHLAIPISSFINGEVKGTFDITNVSSGKLVFNGDITANVDVLENQRIAITNIVSTIVVDPQIPEDAKIVLSKDGKEGTYGDNYSSVANSSIINFSEPIDLSKIGKLEFDFYVENFDRFTSMIEDSNKQLYFAIGTDAEGKKTGLFKFTEQIVGEGWNHISLDTLNHIKSTGGLKTDISSVYRVFLTFDLETGDNSFGDEPYKFINIIGNSAEYNTIPSLPENVTEIITQEGFSSSIGENIPLTFAPQGGYEAKKIFDTTFDLTTADYIEFDIYVSDVEILKAYKDLYLSLYPSDNGGNGYRADLSFSDQLKSNGWNHIKIKKTAAKSRGAVGSYPFKIDWSNVSAAALMTYNSGAPEVVDTGFAVIANICSTLGEISITPNLPQNVVSKINEEVEKSMGAYFGYTQDRIFKEGFGPYDFSKCNTIEFDLYIDDYDLLKQALECERGAKITFCLSSTPFELFSQYQKPRFYYSVQAEIQDQITKTGWNHIKLSKLEFEKYAHTMDWSNVTSYMIRFPLSKLNTSEEEINPAGDVFVKITNIVNTGIIADVPYDEKQAVMPDKNAIYINDAENLVDENGSWNPTEVYVDENYKTENSHSVLREFSYMTDPAFSRMFFLFDYTVDLSDINTLKFDLFIDLPQFIQKSGNALEVGLSSERNFNNGNYKWKIDISKLKAGWNSLEFDISKAQITKEVSLNEIKTIFINFSSLNLSSEDYETIVLGIDNLRYLSKTGNSILRINDGMDDFDDLNDYSDQTEVEEEETVTESTKDTVTETVTLEPKTIHLKETVNKVVTNYTAAIIILCVEFVILSAASVVAFILFKKKMKR